MRKIFTLLLFIFFQFLVFCQKQPPTAKEVNVLVQKGNKYFKDADFENSIKILQVAFNQAKIINNDTLAAFACNRIARNFIELSEVETALVYFDKALFYAEKAKDDFFLTTIYINLGNVYSFSDKKNFAKGLDYYKNAIKLSKKIKDSSALVTTNMNIAQSYFDNKKFDEGYPYLLFFNKYFDKYGQEEFAVSKNMLNGMYYASKNEDKKANTYFLDGINYSKEIVLKEDKQYLYLEYSRFLYKTGDYKNAYINLEMYYNISKKLFNDAKISRASIEGVHLQLNDYKKDLEIMAIEKKLQSQNLEKSNIINILIFIVLLILSLLLFSFYKNIKFKSKNNLKLVDANLQLQEAIKKAEKVSKIKTQFVSTISHELRTPLYGVIGITNIIAEEHKDLIDNEQLNSLKFSAKYLLALVNDILQINKLEDSKKMLEKKTFDIYNEITSIKKSLEFIAQQNNNNFIINIENTVPRNIKSDEVRLSQILMNLLSNALKFTKNGEVNLLVTLEKVENNMYFIKFTVKDTGIGIAKKDQSKIFEKFTQIERQSNDYQGTGLGLAIVKDLLDLFESKIYVESEENKGTTFYFTIGFEKDNLIKNTNILEIKSSNKTYSILVVEDNKINQMVTKKIIMTKNHHCVLVSDGLEALSVLQNDKFDIILMDISMPKIDGYQTTLKIRELGINTPVLALTAYDKNEVYNKAIASGINDVLIKPFEADDLFEKMRNLI